MAQVIDLDEIQARLDAAPKAPDPGHSRPTSTTGVGLMHRSRQERNDVAARQALANIRDMLEVRK